MASARSLSTTGLGKGPSGQGATWQDQQGEGSERQGLRRCWHFRRLASSVLVGASGPMRDLVPSSAALLVSLHSSQAALLCFGFPDFHLLSHLDVIRIVLIVEGVV